MKRPVSVFVCLSLVLLVGRIEWNNRFSDHKQETEPVLRSDKDVLLQTISMNERALRSHRLSLKSKAAVVLDPEKSEVLFRKNMERELPVASLTKLMSALVFLGTHPDLDGFTTITAADANCRGTSELKVGETVTFINLLHASLMSSSNRATRALARASGLSPSEFVARMNRKARQLGLASTFFCEPTGLDDGNTSSALDCARLLYIALQDSVIASISGKTEHGFVSLDRSRSRHRILSTNKLLFNSLKVRGSKTGHNGASGWCLGTVLEGEDGQEIVAVVLGAPTKHSRLEDIRSVVQWCLERKNKGT
jgi:D-alanyl-D-alanine endopeptidase (penicillin-binding protein 7)